MKLIHLSDLHLGKRLGEYSLLEDQQFILRKITGIVDDEKPDLIVIAGDVYDKPVPPAEAVRLFDDFLTRLSKRVKDIFIISGNHDSAERIAFGSQIMSRSGIHMSPVFSGKVQPTVLSDEYGEFSVYMLPFIKPVTVRRFFETAAIETYTDAVNAAIDAMDADFGGRNIIVTHQFVTGAKSCDSEEISVGGSDNVDSSAFDGFDYVALGHLHGPQNVGDSRIRYCGTPLKYSFSEAEHEKSVTVVEIREKGTLDVRTVPLVPRRDMRELRGSFDHIMSKECSSAGDPRDYLRIILTDENEIPEALGKLRSVYPNIMSIDYDNHRTRSSEIALGAAETETKSPLELFGEFYELSNGITMSEEQSGLMQSLIESIWEGEE